MKNGSFVLHRAVGQDGQMENEDLLEVRWPGIFENRCIVFQDRLRDITLEEMMGRQSWDDALTALTGKSSSFDPQVLAAEDPGIFWSCVRHAIMTSWSPVLRQGREEGWKLRGKVQATAGSMDVEFPGQEREEVAMAALVEVLGLLPKLPGHRSGLEVQIIGNEREKGSVAAMEKLESFMNLPKSKQEEIVAKDQEIKAKHEKKEAKRREKGRPAADFQLTGQERCCGAVATLSKLVDSCVSASYVKASCVQLRPVAAFILASALGGMVSRSVRMIHLTMAWSSALSCPLTSVSSLIRDPCPNRRQQLSELCVRFSGASL